MQHVGANWSDWGDLTFAILLSQEHHYLSQGKHHRVIAESRVICDLNFAEASHNIFAIRVMVVALGTFAS